MEIGKTIEKLPLAEQVEGEMKIPTGGFGDRVVTIDQLRTFMQTNIKVYLTNNPTLLSKNGRLQKLVLLSNGKLTTDIPTGGYISVKVDAGYDLDISEFINVNGFVRDKRFQCTILICNYLGEKLLMGSNYIESTDPIPPPNDVVTCEGAANYFDIYVYKPTVNPDPANPELNLIIDGVLQDQTNPPPSWLVFSAAPDRETPTGFDFVASSRFTNTDSANHLFDIATTGNSKLIITNNSGTVIELETEKHFGFCLTHT